MTKPVRTRKRGLLHTASPVCLSTNASTANDPNDALHLAICYVDPGTLKPPRRRLRVNRTRQMAAIRGSMAEFGFLNPILVDGSGRIICGHARWLAAKDLGLVRVPTICADHLTVEQKRLYALAENRIAELGEWDADALRLEFAELGDLEVTLNLDLELTGFAMSEIDDMLVEPVPSEAAMGATTFHQPVTRAGDLWLLDRHRLLCGDALEHASYERLLQGEPAQMAFVDAPYNQPMNAISGKGRVQHEEFAMASGEMSRDEFTNFLETAFGLMARHSIDGAIHYQCMDWHHLREMLDAGEAVYGTLRNLIVWNKGTGGMGSFYRSQHELVFVWKVGDGKPINNFGLGDTGRYRTNVWDYRGNNTFHAGRDSELAAHPTVKPVALIADAMRDCSHRGGIVLDSFGGSGSTLLAAEHTGRRARLIEIAPNYCDRTIERWQAMTGDIAVLAESGEDWFAVAEQRGIDLVAKTTVETIGADNGTLHHGRTLNGTAPQAPAQGRCCAACRCHAVGPGNPPRDTRFKPGQSGNPAGRPRKERDLLKHIHNELDAEMQVTENGEKLRLTKREVLAKRMVNDALQGDAKATTALLRLLGTASDSPDNGSATVPIEVLLGFLHRQVPNGE